MSSPNPPPPPVKLAILDDYASIAPAHFSSRPALTPRLEISSFPNTLDAKTPAGQKALVERLKPFTIISTMRERTAFPASVIHALPNLKLLLTTGVRNAAIDVSACAERGVVVAGTTGRSPHGSEGRGGSVPGYAATNEQCWALILGLAKRVASNDWMVKEGGGWQSGLSVGLAGRTLGVLGLGRLGAECARTGVYGFGMEVVAWSSSLTQQGADQKAEGHGLPRGTYRVVGSKRALFEEADVLSVQYVLSERSRGMVGVEELGAMKRDALLVNTSRGPLVDERALLETLREGRIRGAALDVFDVEPLGLDSEWRTTKWGEEGRSEVLLSPHVGYVEERTMHTWYEETAENVELWLDGKEVKTRFQSI